MTQKYEIDQNSLAGMKSLGGLMGDPAGGTIAALMANMGISKEIAPAPQPEQEHNMASLLKPGGMDLG